MNRSPAHPRFSPTRLKLYETCPKAYSFYYDQKLRWGGTSAAQSLGGSLHRALEAAYKHGGGGAASHEELKAFLDRHWSSAGYATPDEAAHYRRVAEDALAAQARTEPEPGRVTLAAEKTFQHRYDAYTLFGKIDRLDRRADGVLEVIDYKSGRRWDEADLRASLALGVYQVLVAHAYPGSVVMTGVLDLRSGEGSFIARSPAEIEDVERRAHALAAAALNDSVKAPTPGEACRTCPYPRLCPPGRAWLRRQG